MPFDDALTDEDYRSLADFRYVLRRFIHFSEQAAAEEDLTPRQHQALLAIRGNREGATNVALLAARLCLKHHTVAELVQRLEKSGLIHKAASAEDGRSVVLSLTAEGQERLNRLTISHRAELKHIGPEIIKRLSKLSA